MLQALYPFVPHLASEIWETNSKNVSAMGLSKEIERQEWDDIAKLLE